MPNVTGVLRIDGGCKVSKFNSIQFNSIRFDSIRVCNETQLSITQVYRLLNLCTIDCVQGCMKMANIEVKIGHRKYIVKILQS